MRSHLENKFKMQNVNRGLGHVIVKKDSVTGDSFKNVDGFYVDFISNDI